MTDESKTTLTDGSPVTEDHREIDPKTGMQKGYVVLSAEERAKGFVQPVRRSYRHVGIAGPANPLRDLTEDEKARYAAYGYVKYEDYDTGSKGISDDSVVGRFWTQQDLDRVGKGCGRVTTMGQALAETYARNPKFYGGTFCAICHRHFPVGAQGEFVWEGTDERVGT